MSSTKLVVPCHMQPGACNCWRDSFTPFSSWWHVCIFHRYEVVKLSLLRFQSACKVLYNLFLLQVWSKYTDKLEDFRALENSGQAVCCLNDLVTNALTHIPDVMEYMSRINNQSVFNFCAIPQVWASNHLPSPCHVFLLKMAILGYRFSLDKHRYWM